MKLRITGAASLLALAVCLALLTTGAFAQHTQVSQKTLAHKVVTSLGGGPLPAAPAYVAPAPAAAPAAAPAPQNSLGLGFASSNAQAGGSFLGHSENNSCGNNCGGCGHSCGGADWVSHFGDLGSLGVLNGHFDVGHFGDVGSLGVTNGHFDVSQFGDLGSLGIFNNCGNTCH